MSLIKLAITRWKKELPILEKLINNTNIKSSMIQKNSTQETIKQALKLKRPDRIVENLPISHPLRRASYQKISGNSDLKAVKIHPEQVDQFVKHFGQEETIGKMKEQLAHTAHYGKGTHDTVQGGNFNLKFLGTNNKHIDVYSGSPSINSSNIFHHSIVSPKAPHDSNVIWATTNSRLANNYGNMMHSSVPLRDILRIQGESTIPSNVFKNGLKK